VLPAQNCPVRDNDDLPTCEMLRRAMISGFMALAHGLLPLLYERRD
jgi:hypothetical protein